MDCICPCYLLILKDIVSKIYFTLIKVLKHGISVKEAGTSLLDILGTRV